MSRRSHAVRGSILTATIGLFAIALAGCSGDDGAAGAPGAPAAVPPTSATTLNMTITGVKISSPPVVDFKVTNEIGVGVAGLTLNDLRFTIAKLVPGSNGNPSAWQNYINTASSGLAAGYVRGNREGGTTGTLIGTLVDKGDGTYNYTFKTDITDVTKTCPVSPCIDADGNTLDTSYNASLTHRVVIQTRGTLPLVNAIYTFRPSDGATTGLFSRDIVKREKCNECHNQLQAHDQRIEPQYCVTCHNPGSTANGQTGLVKGPQTVDFKVMIHKIHSGEELPSTVDADGTTAGSQPGDYGIIGFSGALTGFGTVVLPQDIRNCTKCHDGTSGAANATPQGDNWKTQPSMAACGSCHDNVYFGSAATKPYQTVAHPGGVQTDNAQCLTCHKSGSIAGSIEESHSLPAKLKAESAKYQLNIISVTNTAPGQSPVIKFSITDPTNNNAFYNLKTDTRLSAGSFSVLVAWNNKDENNTGSTSNPGQPLNIGLTGTSAANAVDNGDGTYTVDLATAILGAGVTNRVIPIGTTGSGRVGFYGRAAVDVDPNTAGAERIRIKAAVKDYAITDAAPVARRKVVDIAKCDKCHDQLSLHGDARTDEPGLCVNCHNPSATDITRRPKIADGSAGAGFPNAAVALDKKPEEAIDFKRMIHAIHAGGKTTWTGEAGHGFREKGIVVYGFGNTANDFSHVRFPGILNDCLTCHLAGTYELTGNWMVPTQSGVLGSTILTTPTVPTDTVLANNTPLFNNQLADQADDHNITPTAAVCSSCHDGQVAQSHMMLNGALFSATQAVINTGATLEACAICHGPGRVADVKVIHGVK
jgi:OmcA/MtrC family decaheme c-type cytochrome